MASARSDRTSRAATRPSPQRVARAAAVLGRAAWRPERPDRMPRAMLAMAWNGPTLAGAVAGATARYPLAQAVVDDAGSMTYARMWAASDALARDLRDRGVGPGTVVGLLARNHRDFVIALVGVSKVGADVVYLNTAFAGPQLADVVAHEGVTVMIHDDEFAELVGHCRLAVTIGGTELAELAARRSLVPFRAARTMGRTVILTSGTTGRPKGASRGGSSGSVDSLTPLLAAVPIRARDTVLVAAPLFHAWGLAHLGVTLAMSSTAVLQTDFEPEATLAAIAEQRPDGLVVVPVMLQRILALGGETIARYDTSSLRYIASSGSALGASLATAVLNRFGPILYNIYGSTEVAMATIARPDDLHAAPSTAGRVAEGSTVRILDDAGTPLPAGQIGRVFVGSGARFDGYTGGGGKETIDGLLSSGDVGHFDGDGLLFIDGRDDDMIVSGGENVFPAEVEDLLGAHPAVAEAAVIGVADESFGQRLRAFVVVKPDQALTAAAVKEHVRTHLARYKVPGQVVFVDQLPRTATGKLRRQDLS